MSERTDMVLGIESSCDETAAAVVSSDGTVLSSVIASQIPIHARYGGVVPELASRAHLTAIRPTIVQALTDAGLTLADLSAIAVTAGPGLSGSLLVGLQAAKALAWAQDLPLIPIDHVQAHVDAIFLRDGQGAGANPPTGPYIALAVSGGHTSLMRVAGPAQTETLGATMDDAAGEAFDKVAKMMGLPYPGGIEIDRLALQGDRKAVPLPRPVLHKGLNFSFSGLKTAVRYAIEAQGGPSAMDDRARADMAASAQEAIVDVLCAKSIRACREAGCSDLVIAGGVACNSRLRARIVADAGRAQIRVHLTPARYCSDNAAMIAGLGQRLWQTGDALRGRERLSVEIHTTARQGTAHAPR